MAFCTFKKFQNMDFIPEGKRKQRGQGIVKVSDLFKKYTDVLRAPQGSVVEAFLAAIFETLGIRLEKDQCTYTVSSKTLMVRAPGMIKSEIKLQKQTILKKMEEKLGKKSVPKEIL